MSLLRLLIPINLAGISLLILSIIVMVGCEVIIKNASILFSLKLSIILSIFVRNNNRHLYYNFQTSLSKIPLTPVSLLRVPMFLLFKIFPNSYIRI